MAVVMRDSSCRSVVVVSFGKRADCNEEYVSVVGEVHRGRRERRRSFWCCGGLSVGRFGVAGWDISLW